MIGCVFETIGRVVMTSVFANSTTYTNWILNEVNGHCVTQNAINDLIMRRSLFTIVLTLRNVFISSNVFFLKVEKKNCLCKDNSSCIDQLKNQCSSSIIQYSNGAIIAPYAFNFTVLCEIGLTKFLMVSLSNVEGIWLMNSQYSGTHHGFFLVSWNYGWISRLFRLWGRKTKWSISKHLFKHSAAPFSMFQWPANLFT